jgi:hypothetical protein
MSWNYRVIRRVDMGATTYAIHEVYYDAAGKPHLVSEEAMSAMGETPDELRADLDMMLAAFALPALDFETLADAGGLPPTGRA